MHGILKNIDRLRGFKPFNYIPLYFCLVVLFLPFFAMMGEVITLDSGQLKRFAALFDQSAYTRLTNSVGLALYTTVFSVFFAFIVYLCFLSLSSSKKLFLVVVALIPLSYPPFGVASGWMTMAAVWEQAGSGRIVWGPQGFFSTYLYSLPGAGFLLALCFWPIVFYLLSTLAEPTESQINAARLTLKPSTRFWRIILPAWLEPLFIASVLVFSLALVQFEVPSLFQLSVYPLEIFMRISALMEEKEAMVLCLPYLLLVPIFGLLLYRAQKTFSTNIGQASIGPIPVWLRVVIYIGVLLVFFLSCILPLLGLMIKARSMPLILNVIWEHMGTSFKSLGYSVVSGAVMVGLGLWMTNFIQGKKGIWISAGILFMFLLPGIIVASGWLRIRSFWPGRIPAGMAYFSMLCAYVSHYFIIGYGTGLLLWSHFGTNQKRAASLMNIGWFSKVRRLYLPSFWYPAIPCIFVTSLFVWRDVAITILLHPPGGESLTVEYYNLLHYGSESQTSAIGFLLLLLPTVLILVGSIMLRFKSHIMVNQD